MPMRIKKKTRTLKSSEKYGVTKAMTSKSFATKRYMNGGMVMSNRGVRDTKMS